MFITLMVARLGADGNPVGLGTTTDSVIFGYMTVYGFFYIVLMQLVANLSGEPSPRQVGFTLSVFLARLAFYSEMCHAYYAYILQRTLLDAVLVSVYILALQTVRQDCLNRKLYATSAIFSVTCSPPIRHN